MALKNKKNLSRAIALLDRGMSIGDAVRDLQRRYHPNASAEEVRATYFGKGGLFAISTLEGRPHEDMLDRLITIRRFSKMMRERRRDPKFAEAQAESASKRLHDLHKNPEFAAAHAKRSSERMIYRNSDPTFIALRVAGKRKARVLRSGESE